VTQSGTRVEVLSLPKGRIAVRVALGGGSAARLYALYLDD
jgi:hypothetical protein